MSFHFCCLQLCKSAFLKSDCCIYGVEVGHKWCQNATWSLSQVSASPVLTATHHSYGSLAWLSDFFPGSPLEVRPPNRFWRKWLKRCAFTQGWYFCSKNRNFSYPLISRAPKRSKFCKFLDLEIFRSIWPLTLEVTERTPLILHRSPMKVA